MEIQLNPVDDGPIQIKLRKYNYRYRHERKKLYDKDQLYQFKRLQL